jgi:hypothetical protein
MSATDLPRDPHRADSSVRRERTGPQATASTAAIEETPAEADL